VLVLQAQMTEKDEVVEKEGSVPLSLALAGCAIRGVVYCMRLLRRRACSRIIFLVNRSFTPTPT
jgi:hypothetical protein